MTELIELQEAITEFACRAAEKLRKQNSHTGQIMAFIRTSPFRQQDPQYSRSASIPLPSPTSDSAHITQAAKAIVKHLQRRLQIREGRRDADGPATGHPRTTDTGL